MSSKGPSLFSDIGKLSRDILTKGYNSDQRFTISSSTNSGIDLHSTLLKSRGLSSDFVSSAKAVASIRLPDYKSGKIEVQYLHDHAGFTTFVDLNCNPAIDFLRQLVLLGLHLAGGSIDLEWLRDVPQRVFAYCICDSECSSPAVSEFPSIGLATRLAPASQSVSDRLTPKRKDRPTCVNHGMCCYTAPVPYQHLDDEIQEDQNSLQCDARLPSRFAFVWDAVVDLCYKRNILPSNSNCVVQKSILPVV
ncbi:hypothetical protein KIW84_072817 [Lathyrus oleraceus]|uniref:Uncharacterized protein n=1 Tax=Pisum sativum TaxID=3888 RepID=A0A9D4VM04_PEA|nr:hypothetical protein KIW84_072817 [Pisum sativum]